jgi:hypothetical protein
MNENGSIHSFLLGMTSPKVIEASCKNEFGVFLVHGDNLKAKLNISPLAVIDYQSERDKKHDMLWLPKRVDSTYMVNPENSQIQSCAAIFFEQVEIYVENIARFERSSHFEENVQISGPFPDDAWDEFCAQLPGFPTLNEIWIQTPSDSPKQDERRE